MKGLNTILLATLTGQVAGIAVCGIELISTVTALLAALIMIVAGVYVYLYAGIWQKLAITPLFISCIIYMAYSIIPSLNPTESVDYLCMLLDSLGLIFIASYFLTNERETYVKRWRQETDQEKTNPAQEKAYTKEEMRMF